jgi:hypothetical protein
MLDFVQDERQTNSHIHCNKMSKIRDYFDDNKNLLSESLFKRTKSVSVS